MAENTDNKTSANAPTDAKKDDKKVAQSDRKSGVGNETNEQRREAFDTSESKKIQDGRAVNLGQGLVDDPNSTDPDKKILDPDTGKIDPDSGAERITFQQTRLKVVNGHTVLTDHLKGDDEKLIDLQTDVADNEHAPKSQWRW